MTVSSPPDFSRYALRNRLAFFADYVLFGLGLTFASGSTILPAFAARLTDSKILIGAVGSVLFGAWLLPQILAANYLSDKREKYPHMIRGSWVGRPFFWLYAIFLVLGGAAYPALALVLLLIGLAIFSAMDAYVALAWFDLFGKAMPPNERGRVVGLGQLVNGLLAVGAGWLVNYLLSENGLAFPYSYAIIFTLAGICFMASLLACYYIVELPGEVKETMAAWRDYIPQLGAVFKHDRSFARFNAVRLLAGLHGMATPFYVIYATRVAGLPDSSIGVFLTAQTIGTALAGIGLGLVADRKGSHRVIQISSVLEVVAVIAALVLALGGFRASVGWIYPLIFAIIGIVEGSLMLGYFNYLLDISPSDNRPVYMGLTNTLAGLLVIMPLIGGWILEHFSFTALFALTAIGIIPAAFLAFTLPKAVRHEPAPVSHGVEASLPAA
ncbi:MAG: MFS transporter [Chloroflexi bacterium]|nr:MFS transporter [Chloroflexota bacterium]